MSNPFTLDQFVTNAKFLRSIRAAVKEEGTEAEDVKNIFQVYVLKDIDRYMGNLSKLKEAGVDVVNIFNKTTKNLEGLDEVSSTLLTSTIIPTAVVLALYVGDPFLSIVIDVTKDGDVKKFVKVVSENLDKVKEAAFDVKPVSVRNLEENATVIKNSIAFIDGAAEIEDLVSENIKKYDVNGLIEKVNKLEDSADFAKEMCLLAQGVQKSLLTMMKHKLNLARECQAFGVTALSKSL